MHTERKLRFQKYWFNGLRRRQWWSKFRWQWQQWWSIPVIVNAVLYFYYFSWYCTFISHYACFCRYNIIYIICHVLVICVSFIQIFFLKNIVKNWVPVSFGGAWYLDKYSIFHPNFQKYLPVFKSVFPSVSNWELYFPLWILHDICFGKMHPFILSN